MTERAYRCRTCRAPWVHLRPQGAPAPAREACPFCGSRDVACTRASGGITITFHPTIDPPTLHGHPPPAAAAAALAHQRATDARRRALGTAAGAGSITT